MPVKFKLFSRSGRRTLHLQLFGEFDDNMGKDCADMNETRKCLSSRADFIRWAVIGPELAEFVDTFIDKPEIFFSMSSTKRREIEHQMDSILSAFGQ